MSTPKTVVFDLGKVLLDFDYAIAARKLINAEKISIGEFSKVFTSPAEILLKYESGLVTTQQFYAQVCSMTGYGGNIEEFAACFGDIFSPIQPMIDAQAAIQRSGIPTYIFSNTNELAMRHIRSAYSFMGNFDGLILSYEHGAMKPDHALYEVVERRSGFKGADIVYIDDRPENIAAGAARGWRVILQEEPEKTLRALQGLGVLYASLASKCPHF